MADTDIYKSRERMPVSRENTRRYSKRKRRSSHGDEERPRKRRSKNSGLRRLLHLYRKEKSQRIFLWIIVILVIALLVYAIIWDLVVKPKKIYEKENPFTQSPINSTK